MKKTEEPRSNNRNVGRRDLMKLGAGAVVTSLAGGAVGSKVAAAASPKAGKSAGASPEETAAVK